MNRLLFVLVMLLLSSSLWALQIDEKLTVRILKVSQTQKTMLLNRGLEDGLVVNDHAKFYLTSGVIARAVVIKASPARSIWSIYSLTDKEAIATDKVVKLKISSPMVITEDESKTLSAKDGKVDEAIPLAEGASDMTEDEKSELSQMSVNSKNDGSTAVAGGDESSPTMISGRLWEVWGSLYGSMLSRSVDSGTTKTTGSNSAIDFTVGVERYFDDPSSMLSKIALMGFVNKSMTAIGDSADTQAQVDYFEFGGGFKWFFKSHPMSYNKPQFYFKAALGMGSVSKKSGTTTTTGSTNFMLAGLGVKFITIYNLSFYTEFDIFKRGETYTSDPAAKTTATSMGPRFLLGIGYRF